VSAFHGGPKNFTDVLWASFARIQKQILWLVPWKAERTPVQGAGFSPEAVPSKQRKKEGAEPSSHIPLILPLWAEAASFLLSEVLSHKEERGL
jgi:hypothetical protein